ncbi:MAG TPA: alpha/beta hydrolase domain-containing protein [Bryobacteraceae bacterium]|jgi:hypothetical protein|nr:alpha/beta hydrolase domain-containing protein [Bryobacteraceae bacterium]
MKLRLCALGFAFVSLVSARVTGIDITGKSDAPDGYQRLIGKAHFAVDPKLPANQIIADIKYAPVNAAGMVEFSADLYIYKPDPAKSNHTVIFEVSNRGGRSLVSTFDRGSGADEFGDRMLLDQGYTIVWLGWEADVPHRPNLLRLDAPVATDHGKSITGLVLSEFIPDSRTTRMHLADRQMIPYPLVEARELTVRDSITGQRRPVARSNWTLKDGEDIIMESGFEPGKLYEFIYTAKDPTLVGLGPAGVRDLISYFKYGTAGGDALPLGDEHRSIKQAYGFGISQSGRFLRKYLYDGFNADEQGRKVFDGLMIHVAGGGLGSFNHRFAEPSRDGHPFMNNLYPTDMFPFTDLPETDPQSGMTDAVLANAVKANVVPKIFYTNSSGEYWGRSAALIHTTPDGKGDAKLPDTTRAYMFAGGQHSPAPKPVENVTLNPTNPNDYRWMLRALLVAMDAWVKNGTPPPDSVYPKIGDKTLVPLAQVHFPAIPGEHLPTNPKRAWRFDFGPEFRTAHVITVEPPKVGEPFPTEVPQVDADGIDLGGLRMPAVAVPLATYTGWNPRGPSVGAPDQLYSMQGSFLPFPLTAEQAAAKHDPRKPVSARYADRDAYLAKVREAGRALVGKRYLLDGDVEKIVTRAGLDWDLVHAHPGGLSE